MSHYHQDKVQFFYSLNPEQMKNKHQELNYSVISRALEPHATQSDFISTEILCTNRELPYESYNKDQNALTLNDSNLARRALMLKRPSIPYYFEQNKKEQWRIISHLSLNNLSLMKGDAVSHIKELLALYNLSKSKENQIIIDAIKNIQFSTTQKLVESKPFPLFVRGLKVEVEVDAEVFRGHSLYIFSQLLTHVFNLKVNMNSFVDVIIVDVNTQQELYQCVQNVGGKTAL